MKPEKLEEALNQISDKHIQEAVTQKKRHTIPWVGAIAAILALVLCLKFIEIPMAVSAEAVSLPKNRVTDRPDYDDPRLDIWLAERDQRATTATQALTSMKNFIGSSCKTFLAGEGNQLYSPINAYMGLAMVAELTAGSTRQQLLDALGAADTETLQQFTSALWESAYFDDEHNKRSLASSLWLDEGIPFTQSVMDTLAYDYYASVYRQDLQSKQVLKDIQAWLNNNTGGFLKDAVDTVSLPEETLLVIYSTVYFQAKWSEEFNASQNTDGLFHSPDGDTTVTFMNKKLTQRNYYWGDSFGAINLGLKNNSQMWFILPDQDKTIQDVLEEGQYLELILSNYAARSDYENQKYMKVNLSIPKFDVQAKKDLRQGFEKMGITELWNDGRADFSTSLEEPAHITSANQAVRVQIDETGVTAAAYIELPVAGDPPPPEEIIDFVVDRPFLFIITTNSGIPLFAGTVTNP